MDGGPGRAAEAVAESGEAAAVGGKEQGSENHAELGYGLGTIRVLPSCMVSF